MKTLIPFILSQTAVALVGCSSGAIGGGQPSGKFTEQTLLTLVGFTGSVVKVEKRFAGYTKRAQRISLIDPAGEKEVWGVQLDTKYDLATPLPEYTGVAVLTGQTLKLVQPGAEARAFKDIEFPIGFVGRARDQAAYAMASLDGSRFHVVRRLGPSGAGWEEETFAEPWEDESKYAAPPDGQPPLAVTLMGNDGNHLMYIKPADGRYAYYKGTPDAPLKLVGQPCYGDHTGSADAATYRTMALDDDTHAVYAGDIHGLLTAFATEGACSLPAQRAHQNLGDGSPITDIDVLGGGELLVTQAGGRVHALHYDGTNFTLEASYAGVCAYPLGALPAGASRLAVVCYTPKNFDPAADSKTAPAVITYSDAFVQIYDTGAKAGVLKIPVDVDKAAGMAIDGEQSRILTLRDDALGVLDVVSLIDGSSHEKKGLFLSDILE